MLYPVLLSPEIAALAMSGSSVLEALTALSLKRLHLTARGAPSPTAPEVTPALREALKDRAA